MKKLNMRASFVILCFAFLMVLMSACSPNLSELAITGKLTENADNFMPNSDEKITSIEITKRDTHKEEKTEEVWFTVNSNDDEAEYIRYFIAGFKLYDKGGWQYIFAETDQNEKPSATPIAGVSDETVKEIIATQGLKTPIAIGEDNWQANSNTIKSVTVGTHNTRVEQKKDTVTVAVVLEDVVQIAEGEVELTFVYDNGWQYQDYAITTPFMVSQISGTEKDLTAEDFVALVISQDNLRFVNQTVRFGSDDVSDVTLVNSSAANKGTQQSYEYSFNVTKAQGRIAFAVTAQVDYRYSDGWQPPSFSFANIEMTTLDLTGVWSGVGRGYIGGGWGRDDNIQVDFEITQEGSTIENVSVSFWTPSSQTKNTSALMRVNMDPSNLTINFTCTEWVQPPLDPAENIDNLPQFLVTIQIEDFSLLSDRYNYTKIADVKLTLQAEQPAESTSEE